VALSLEEEMREKEASTSRKGQYGKERLKRNWQKARLGHCYLSKKKERQAGEQPERKGQTPPTVSNDSAIFFKKMRLPVGKT